MKSKPTEQFVQWISALATTFGREADEPLFLGYWFGLHDIPSERLKQAIIRATQEKKQFMPTPAELRELAGEMSHSARAVMAWQEFRRGVERHGYYTTVCFADPVINATVENLGGWMVVSQITGEDFEKWLRKDFERVYIALCERPLTDEQSAPLMGYYEQQNKLSGFEADESFTPKQLGFEPVMIETKLPALPHNDSIEKRLDSKSTMPVDLTTLADSVRIHT